MSNDSQYPNMKCMYITIYVHSMQVDEMFDFITGRIETPPAYWTCYDEIPPSISGGYVQISISYDTYSHVRSVREQGIMFDH